MVDKGKIKRMFSQFIIDIFGVLDNSPIDLDWNLIYSSSLSELCDLEAPFSLEKIKEVVFSFI